MKKKKWTMDIKATGRVSVYADTILEAIDNAITMANDYLHTSDNYLGFQDISVNTKSVEIDVEDDENEDEYKED